MINYLIKVENKDEEQNGEREKKSRVHMCLVAGPGHDLALHAIHTNLSQNQPMHSMFRILPVQKNHQVQEAKPLSLQDNGQQKNQE